MPDQTFGKPVAIRGLNKSYGLLRVLHDISLDIQAGEFCTLLGASGSGKTTLLKVVAGFEPFETGTVHVDGRDISHVPVSRRNIGMVFQNYALFPHMTVRRNVAFGLEMRRLARHEIDRRVDEVLTLVSLEAYGDRLPRALSGGQQQRVALARALVINPDILLMDEPLGALDKNLRQAIQLQLKALHRELGVTIIYVTHDQEEALHLSDRIVVMDEGRVVQAGSAHDLYFRPINPFVAGFLGECNFLPDGAGQSIAVRPECLRLVAGADDADRCVDAVVEDVIFLGTGNKIVASADGVRVIALTPNTPAGGAPSPGEAVRLGFASADVMRF